MGVAGQRVRSAAIAALLLVAGIVGSITDAAAEQASEPASASAGGLDAGGFHSCALTASGAVRCWGFGGDGQLGYANTATIGDDETPAAAGPVDAGGTAVTAIATGDAHTCALLGDGSVHCWGFGGDGRTGYANTSSVGDDETPASVGAVAVGGPAKAITAGAAHTCALLVDGSVRCWGFGGTDAVGRTLPDGRLGYGNNDTIGDNEVPAAVGPVNLGVGNKAVAISAGGAHTCALLGDGTVRCWGVGRSGQLGYASTANVGDTPTSTPDRAGSVNLGVGNKAVAISAGGDHTCALLADGSVRCWGQATFGQLGYGNRDTIGDDETPATAGAVNLGGRTAQAISAGESHTCAILDDGSVRCWGLGSGGRLGYANTATVGDDETPASVGPVDLGPGRTATAISAGSLHTCARLDDGRVRCWGFGAAGRLGYCADITIGDDETPGSTGPVELDPGDGGARCAPAPHATTEQSAAGVAQAPVAAPPPRPAASAADDGARALAAQSARARALHRCLNDVARRANARRRDARRLPARSPARARAIRQLDRRTLRDRGRCLHRYARTPGRVTNLHAQNAGPHAIVLTFRAVGTDHARPPAARRYVIKQSLRPIRTSHDFSAAHGLCGGRCTFAVTRVGTTIAETVVKLRRGRSYHYAIAALDNVSGRRGPRSRTISARTG